MASAQTTMMTSPHIPCAYQPPSISAMIEQLNVSQPKNERRFRATAGTDSQNVEFMTTNHRGMLILPHSLLYHAHQDQLMELLQSRWHEHLGEALLLVPRGRNEGIKLQKSLMEHRLRRAQLETALYTAALGLSSGGLAQIAERLVSSTEFNKSDAEEEDDAEET